MPKPIIISIDGAESSFDHAKLDRARLYGARKRIPLDQDGQPCIKAALTEDGLYLLRSGMTAQGYFDETGRWLERSELVGLDPQGQVLALKPGTLGVAQAAQAVDPSDLLRYSINAVYALDPLQVDSALAQRLESGEVFRFGFNYGSDHHEETAFLVKNAEGHFCLVGAATLPVWCEPGKVSIVEATAEAAEEDLDFEMF
jgi:hypothetical protein